MLKDDSSSGGQAGSSEDRKNYPMSTRYPGRHDLLLGRGGETNNHSGNIKFRRLLEDYRDAYQAAPKGKKPEVSKQLVREWRNLDPPGRFLAKSDSGDTWEDVGDEAAWRRASKSLGERSKRPQQSGGNVGSLKGSTFNSDNSAAMLDSSNHGVKRRRDELVMTGSPTSDRTGFLAQNLGTAPSESMTRTNVPQMPWSLVLPQGMQQQPHDGSVPGSTSFVSTSPLAVGPRPSSTSNASQVHQQHYQYQRPPDQASKVARQRLEHDDSQLTRRDIQLGGFHTPLPQSTGASNPILSTLLNQQQQQQQQQQQHSGSQAQVQAFQHRQQHYHQQDHHQQQQRQGDNHHLQIGLQPQNRADLPTAADLLADNVFTSDSNSTPEDQKHCTRNEESTNQH